MQSITLLTMLRTLLYRYRRTLEQALHCNDTDYFILCVVSSPIDIMASDNKLYACVIVHVSVTSMLCIGHIFSMQHHASSCCMIAWMSTKTNKMIGSDQKSSWLQLMLSSDESAFGGFENLSKKHNTEFASTAGDYDGREHSIQVILVSPSEIALGLICCFSLFPSPVLCCSCTAALFGLPCESLDSNKAKIGLAWLYLAAFASA